MSEMDDHENYTVSEKTAEEMGVLRYSPYVAIAFFLLAGITVFAFQEVFYGVLLAGVGGVFGALFKLSFLVVKAKQLFFEFVG